MTRLLGLLLGLLALACGCGTAPAAPAADPPAALVQQETPPAPDPTRINYPAIGASSSLIPEGLNPDGSMATPSVHDPGQAGWYTYARRPGEVGPALIMGHVDGDGQRGVFYRLRDAKPGDQVSVARADGSTVHFVVTARRKYPKTAVPWGEVLANRAGPELVLVTCGGPLDRAAHSYLDNIVVFARIAG